MTLDNEQQRQTLLTAIDLVVPRLVTGANKESLTNLAELVRVREAVQAATVALPDSDHTSDDAES